MTIHTLPLSTIQPSKANPRTAFDAASIEGLAASIKTDETTKVRYGCDRKYRVIANVVYPR